MFRMEPLWGGGGVWRGLGIVLLVLPLSMQNLVDFQNSKAKPAWPSRTFRKTAVTGELGIFFTQYVDKIYNF